jgi:hypothetical protein
MTDTKRSHQVTHKQPEGHTAVKRALRLHPPWCTAKHKAAGRAVVGAKAAGGSPMKHPSAVLT